VYSSAEYTQLSSFCTEGKVQYFTSSDLESKALEVQEESVSEWIEGEKKKREELLLT
jgi:hypothetical protein